MKNASGINIDEDTLVGEIFIAAAPARVFDAVTNPAQMPRWWGRQGIYQITESSADLRPGGKWMSRGVRADGTVFTIEGEYIKVEPPRRLVQTWNASWSPAPTVVSWELEPTAVHELHLGGPRKAGTGTVVRIIQRQQTFEPRAMMGGNAESWNRVLGWLQEFLEDDETPETRQPQL